MTSIFPIASHVMAPIGSEVHWRLGICRRARAEPRQIRLTGTLAAPMNDAASRTNASGGWPSGAFGIGELGMGVKSAFRG